MNSSQVSKDIGLSSIEWYKNKIITHEIGHVFGLDHAKSKDFVICQGFNNVNYITYYENQLLVGRYGEY